MATDIVSRVHTPAFLNQLAIKYRSPDMFADRLAPRVRVNKQSDKYRVWGKNRLYQRDATWAPGMIPNAVESKWSEDQFFADFRVLRHPFLDAERDNADGDINLRQEYTETTTLAIEIAREARIATLFTTAANYPSSHVITKAGSAEWDTVLAATPSQPIVDISAIANEIADDALVSKRQLTVAIPDPVFRAVIERNTYLMDVIKYSERGIVTADLLAQVLGVKEVIVVNSQTAGAGPENVNSNIVTGITTTYLWGDDVWVGLVAQPGQLGFARSFNWAAGTGGQERQVRQYRMADEGQRGDWIEVAEAIDEKIVSSLAGGVIKNTLA